MNRKTVVFLVIAFLSVTDFFVIPAYGAEQKTTTQQNDNNQVFISELLQWYIIPAIEEQYKTENRIHFAYKKGLMKVSNMALDEFRRPFFLVSSKIKPSWQEGMMVFPDHWDRVTFKVYPALLRRYGDHEGIKLFQYEKNVE